MSKVVKAIHSEMKGYKKWTEVSDALSRGLVGVEVKDKTELTEEEFNNRNKTVMDKSEIKRWINRWSKLKPSPIRDMVIKIWSKGL